MDLFYTATVGEVIQLWSDWEERNFRLQATVEKAAPKIHEENPGLAADFLNAYCCGRAKEALKIARRMIVRLHTIISHYNVPL